jgi:hypothetical protein
LSGLDGLESGVCNCCNHPCSFFSRVFLGSSYSPFRLWSGFTFLFSSFTLPYIVKKVVNLIFFIVYNSVLCLVRFGCQ